MLTKPWLIPSKIVHAGGIELRAAFDVARYGLPDVMLQFGGGIGDELLLTAVARELKKREAGMKIWQVSHSVDLLKYNPDYTKIFSMDHWPLRYARFLERRRCRLAYAIEKKIRCEEIPPDIHIIAALCRNAGIKGKVSARPYLFLTEDEKISGSLAERQIAVQCIADNSYATVMRNKLWDFRKFQDVVDQIKFITGSEMQIVQIGSAHDFHLRGVIDLCGKTTLRQSAAILSQSDIFIGTVGFLMHLARAVECRSVIIYGGREHSSQTGYICNENLNTYLDCSPCWLWHDCEYDRKCMQIIRVEDVLNAYERIKGRLDHPLETEEVCL